MKKEMIKKKTWEEFQKAGLIWWINRILHLFGWALVCEYDKKQILTNVYPARCRFRGFDNETEEEGFEKLTKHLKKRMPDLIKDLDAK